MTENDRRKESVAFMNPGATSTRQLLPQQLIFDERFSSYLNDGFSLKPWGPLLQATIPDDASDWSSFSYLPPYLPTQDIFDGSYHEAVTVSAGPVDADPLQVVNPLFPTSTSCTLTDPMPYANSPSAHLDTASWVSDYATTSCRKTAMIGEKTPILEREWSFSASAAHYAPFSAEWHRKWPLVSYSDVRSQCAPPPTMHDDAHNVLTASQCMSQSYARHCMKTQKFTDGYDSAQLFFDG